MTEFHSTPYRIAVLAVCLFFRTALGETGQIQSAAVDPAAVRSVSVAFAKTAVPATKVSEIESAVYSLLQEQQFADLMRHYAQVRNEYLIDRKKIPAERDAALGKRYFRMLDTITAAISNSISAQALIVNPATDSTKQEYEGEKALDSAAQNQSAMAPIQDIPGLPRILLIGDSISIGYTLQVRALLKGKANVHRIPINGGATEVGLENIQVWLGDGKWDVIHFAFGLHDAKYISETEQRSSREQYADNLHRLIKLMKSTGAKLIFATTTPVPNNGYISPTRRFDSIPARNEIALKVMRENGVAVNDLYTLVQPVQEYVMRPNDVHFRPEGYDLIAKQVAARIDTELSAEHLSSTVR